ncbi:MAG: hypothetical protein HPY69_16150 [Armatimonadetes bacterium]|nr:hypothetical protein [Armatimonadota bacterium]
MIFSSDVTRLTLLALLAVSGGLLLFSGPPARSADNGVSPLGIQVTGPREMLASSPVAVRVVVTDHQARRPVEGARLALYLGPSGQQGTRVFSGRTGADGVLDCRFDVPDLEPGMYRLSVQVRANGQAEEYNQDVRVRIENQVLLTTDKPLYKPGQTMHLRALVLRKPALRPLADTPVTLEVSDSRGNKVFKQVLRTNDFGLVFTRFTLADEVNMGDYAVRALVGDDRVEKSVTVKRYVLPKFKVVVTPDKPYYLPGERLRGTVQCDYFFGKPVADATVKVTLKTFDVAFNEIAVLTGNTDARGTYKFESKLPDSFVGQPLEQGKAFLQVEAEVKDQAEHTETAITSSRVAGAPLEIFAVPENGRIVPGVPNIVYLLVSRPTGEPVKAKVRWAPGEAAGLKVNTVPPYEVTTDELGIAELRLTVEIPADMQTGMGMGRRGGRMMQFAPDMGFGGGIGEPELQMGLQVVASAADGTRVEKEVPVAVGGGSANSAVLLRTDRVLAEVGQTVLATALTNATRGSIFFDLVKDRQTMLTAAADIVNGMATARLDLGPELTGTVWLAAYRILPDGEIARATRPLYVNPANDLNIAVKPDQDTYRPGPDNVAAVHFAVTDSSGKPVAAALGVNVVDESLFAIQEMQPGMEKVYFYLEKELATPRYEIHGFEMPVIIAGKPPVEARPVPFTEDAQKQEAARVMLASVPAPEMPLFATDTYTTRLAEAKQKWVQALQEKLARIQQAIQVWNETDSKPVLTPKTLLAPLVQAGKLTAEDLQDQWGTPFGIAPMSPDDERLWAVILWSYGPDKEKDTEDDFYVIPGWGEFAANSLDEAREMRFGGRGGIMMDGAVLRAVPMAAAAPGMGGGMPMGPGAPEMAMAKGAEAATGAGGAPGAEPVRVRQFFPETLLVEPALITDERGQATLQVPMADSITSWRLTALANSRLGALGSTTGALRCFQDFFVDLDLPVALTQGDQVSVPVAVYNYLNTAQTVKLELTKADWFTLTGPATHELEIGPNQVDVRYFTITAKGLGDQKLLVHGYGSKMSDAIERVATVEPNGKLIESTVSGRLSGTVEQTLEFPAEAIEGASNILVKIYPGIFSQVVEGLDSILQMPFGCFEQTSSATYPNVLVLDYMKATGQIRPEIQMKAEGFINNGYQRLVTFEVPGGGFSWFGEAPANKILTAFGVMEFYDMGRVHEVDPALLQRTQEWLLGQQGEDGSWTPDEAYLHQESWGRIQNSQLPPTAYITWGLAYSQCQDPRVAKARDYLRAHADEAKDPYVLSMLANALVQSDLLLDKGDFHQRTNEVLDRLIQLAKRADGKMWWESEMTGITHSSGQSSDLEATGMAALALIAGNRTSEATEVLSYLVSQKDPNGTWYSTQATVLALRALMAAQKNATQQVDGEVTVLINGQQADAFGLTPENADVMRQVDGHKWLKPGRNDVTIKFEGKGSTLYQIVGKHYLPWDKVPGEGRGALDIKLDYDRTTLAKDDMVTAKVSVRNNLPGQTSMIIVDLGLPPGFELQAEDIANLVENGTLQKFSLTGRQIICYLEKLEAGQVVSFTYRLKAKYPLKAQTPKSTVYEYYNPDRRAEATPVSITVE